MILLLGLLFVVPRTAWADGAHCNETTDTCEVQYHQEIVPDPSTPPSKDGSRDGEKPKYPACSSFRGGSVVALPGTALADLPVADRPEPGWARSSCLEDGTLMWVWSPPRVNVEVMARTLLARLQLRPITIGLTPKRQGSMGFVGVPNWLWVQDPARTTYGPATISAGGISLTAKVELIEWDMGNGDVVRCRNRGTEWFDGMGVKQSPTCGYVYSRQGHFVVRATAHWVARWSGYGQSGAIRLSLTATRPLEIGELQVIITG
ncbi:MAG: hypothetical protein QM619_09635 [Micropruina sp.]|uniref:hypothetical protein n=1 Tax=Micropruina sp. TaxID=2737536 RepID=UPI0039E5927D